MASNRRRKSANGRAQGFSSAQPRERECDLPGGVHAFRPRNSRHSHSTLLHALGVDLKVQQELLRHADVRTTMNIYTQAVPKALREANSKIVRLVLPAQVA